MLFNSLEFFVFLTVVYLAYRILPFHWQNRMLLVAGYVFYGWWDVRFLFLIAFSTTVDFSIGLLLANGQMPIRQRITVSLFLIWSRARFSMSGLVSSGNWSKRAGHECPSHTSNNGCSGASGYDRLCNHHEP